MISHFHKHTHLLSISKTVINKESKAKLNGRGKALNLTIWQETKLMCLTFINSASIFGAL